MYIYQKGFSPIVIALIILVLAGAIGGGYYLINKQSQKQTACTMEAKICPDGSSVGRTGPNCEFADCPEIEVNEAVNPKNYLTKIEKNGLTCYDSSKYFVVSEDGSSSLVKYKETADQNIACEYIVEDGDFKFGNGAEYFVTFVGDYLITDSGTGPGLRGLGIYDLIGRKPIYSSSYEGEITTGINNISYWTKRREKATEENCPKLNEYISQGFSAVIESYVTLDLITLTTKESGDYRCQFAQ
jgi:hypothetical protein